MPLVVLEPLVPDPAMSRCPRCFADLGERWQYCAHCGLPLDPASIADLAHQSPRISYVERDPVRRANRRARDLMLRSFVSAVMAVGIFALITFSVFVVNPDALSGLRAAQEPTVPAWAEIHAASEPAGEGLGGVEMIQWSRVIEPGSFKSGDPNSWSEGEGETEPYHGGGWIEYAFQISLYEITNRQYYDYLFLASVEPSEELAKRWTGGSRDHPEPGPEQDDLPVTGITYDEAAAFAAWLSEDPAFEGARLPSRLEWERAARGVDGRVYPWGNEWAAGRANTIEEACGGPVAGSVYGRPDGDSSYYGVFNMAGNVAEWIYQEDRNLRYAVGGRWDRGADAAQTWKATEYFTYSTDHAVGFRIARYVMR